MIMPSPNPFFGNLNDWEMLHYHGLTVEGRANPQIAELGKIMTTTHASQGALKTAMNGWAERNRFPARFLFYTDLVRLGAELKAKGILKGEGAEIIPNNGLVSPEFYAYLTRNGYMVLADPHDPLCHISSVAQPAFYAEYTKFIELTQWSIDEVPDYPANRPDHASLLKIPDERKRALSVLRFHLTEHVHDSTHENWTYLVKGEKGEPELFMQGNGPFNGFLNFISDRDGFVGALLNGAGENPMSGTPGNKTTTNELRALPHLDRFVKETGSGKLFTRYMALLKQSALDPQAYEQAAAKLGRLYDQHITRLYNTSDYREMEAFAKKLATFIATDPALRTIFERSQKEQLIQTGVELFGRYRNWVDRAFPRR